VGKTHVKKRLGCKVVVSFRGTDLFVMALDAPGYYARVFDDADVVHVLGRQLWAQALKRGCPDTKPHVFIPPGIDESFAAVPSRIPTEWAGTSDRPLRLLSAGRLTWTKGYEFGLQAVRRLLDQGLHCEYRILGEGEARKALTFDIHDLGLESTVRLAGVCSREDVRDHMTGADVFLHPARYEGFCNVVLEAQALGVPVVCSDGGGLAENVAHGETGLIVPRRDAAAMAAAVARLVDPALRGRLGAAGRARATTLFRAERQIEAFERLYRGVLGKEASPVHVLPSTMLHARAGDGSDAQARLVLLDVEADARAGELDRLELVEAIQRQVAVSLPRGARVSVVSRGDDDLLRQDGRDCSHFPAAADGGYVGYHPEGSGQAIAALLAAQAKGAEYLLFPRTSFWWLDHYVELTQHLDRHCRAVVASECCVIFGLGAPPGAAVAASPGPAAAAGVEGANPGRWGP
jgi:hypothetical protein